MMPMSNISCTICDTKIDPSSSINIFSTSFPRQGELLVNFVSRVLRVAISELQNPYICLQCYNLFQMLEQAQKTVLNIRCEILKIYRATERRKNLKQSINNSTKLNIELGEEKLNNSDGNFEKVLNLQRNSQIEEIVQKQCVQNNIVSQNISISNTDCAINNKITMKSKKHLKKETVGYNEANSIKSFEYNNICNDIKKNEILKDDIFNSSVALTNDSNVCNINSQESVHTLKIHVREKNCISLLDSEIESENSAKAEFPDNRLQIGNIDFKWKKVNENITEIKENTKDIAADQVNIPVKPIKIPKSDLKPLKYSCPTCDKKWKTSAELKTHIKTHSSLRPYMCEKCGQAYKHKHALEIHIGMHNGINPFQCNFCNKCFTQKGALMRHLPMHTGEMPYQCEVCGKRFIHHTSYNMHRLSHSGKKSYKCQMCDLSLLSTSHLKRHMRVHTGEKPYSCIVCGKRFAERYNLLAHQKVHGPVENKTKKVKEIQLQCNHCNLMFEEKKSLNDHMKYHSNMNNESNLKQSQCTILQVESEDHELSKKINSEDSVLEETWIQMNRSKLDIIDNQTRFVLLQSPLSQIDENFAVTFSDQKVSLESTNYNTNLHVIIEPDIPLLSNNLPSIDKMHM